MEDTLSRAKEKPALDARGTSTLVGDRMAGKGEALNVRVWKLFDKLGFKTEPSWNSPKEHEIALSSHKKRTVDLFATDEMLRVTVIGWNKARKDLTESITVHIHDYLELKRKANAQAVLFVATELNIDDGTREYAARAGVRIWTLDELSYYETLVDTVGAIAKYEVINALGITTKEENLVFNTLALHIQQPFPGSNTDLFIFTAPPQFLLKTSVVLRKAAGSKDAYQRVINRKRLAQVRNFVTNSSALLPPNIIVHFSDRVSWAKIETPTRSIEGKDLNLARPDDYELVCLSIPSKYASLELIDGQHRLFGFAATDSAVKDRFSLIVAGIANLSSHQRTETFVSINDNARRMDPNLVAYLRYDPDEASCQANHDLMAIKIVVELNKTTPFKRKIRLLDIGDQRITLKGFAGYDLRGLLGPRGLLRKYYPKNRSDDYVGVLRLYFSMMKQIFPKQWDDPDRYIIFTNRGISAFLKLLKSILKTTEAPLTTAVVKKYLSAIDKEWTDKRWEIRELKSSYVGSQGWKDFHRDLVKAVRKHYKEFEA